jgi:tetratricopeptide (TPR) repeat protein
MLALATGRLDDAEALMERAFSHGERAQPAAAIPAVQLQRYALRELQGGAETLEPALREVVAEYPARPVFRCVLAQLCAGAGREAEAAAILAELAAGEFAALPFEQEWLFATAMLAEAAARLGDRAAAAPLYRRLLPFAACNAADLPEGMRGSVSRHLGLLAWTLGHFDDAQAHFEAALAMNERMGAEPWLARTRAEYAPMLEARGGPGDAARARELAAAAAAAERIYRRSPVS